MKKVFVFLGLFLMFVGINVSLAVVPDTLTYQGKLSDSSGSPVNGTVDIFFGIYSTPSGGTASWNETQNSVNVADGIFTVTLGSVTPIPNSVFSDPDLYLGIKVGADTEMTPRQKLHSAPFAIKAGTADTVADNAISSTEITDGSIQEADLDTASVDGRYVNLAGDTMTGGLTLPADGLTVGANQLKVYEGIVAFHDLGFSTGFIQLTSPNGHPGISLYSNDPDNYRTDITRTGQGIGFGIHADTTNPGYDELFISNSGNIGIGTTSPSSKVEIVSTGTFDGDWDNESLAYLKISDGTDRMIFDNNEIYSSHKLFLGFDTDDYLTIRTVDAQGYTDLVRVQNNGNVGIGTTSPGEKLSVAGTIESTSGGIKFPDGTTQATAGKSAPATVMYLKARNTLATPANCPTEWTQADYKLVVDGSSTNHTRTCYTTKSCTVMYLKTHLGDGTPANCPSGWTEADYQEAWGGSGGSKLNYIRSCYICN